MPLNPLKKDTSLMDASYVLLALMGKFKGKLGVHEHLITLASHTLSGIEIRWWIEKLIRIWETECFTAGPEFGNVDEYGSNVGVQCNL